MKKVRARLFAVTVALMAFIASAFAQSVRERDPSWTAPSKDAAKSNPLADQTEVLAGGRKLYGQRCNTCHGDEGGGTDRAPSLLAAEVQAQTDGALFWKITSGNTHAGMPSFSFLPEAQRWQLVLHLRNLAAEGIRARD
jgi:mono/diheme cytochrome c family protein